MTRDEQFEFLGIARDKILKWASQNSIKLHRIEYIVAFVDEDFSFSAWFFYTKDNLLKVYENTGASSDLQKKFLDILLEINYPLKHIKEIDFAFDSHENVKKNYAGSYFARLR